MNMFLITFMCMLALASAISTDLSEWNEYKSKFSKRYRDRSEDRDHMHTFLKNKEKVEEHNKLFKDGQVSYTMSLNIYSDLEYSDFAASMKEMQTKRLKAPKRNKTIEEPSQILSFANVKLPDSIDWVKKGAVSAVKRQGVCGACWAFSVAGALEGQHFRKTGRLVSLSAQNLLDCTDDEDLDKCDGGFVHDAFDYIKRNRGIDSEDSYPYEGRGDSCKYKRRNRAAKLRAYKDLPEGDETRLQQALVNVGPISVSVDALHDSFQFYSGGIYENSKCGSRNRDLNHAMLLVGYGTDRRGKPYWLIKNSWGTEWGEKGYMRLARNKKNHCGIATEATYPIV